MNNNIRDEFFKDVERAAGFYKDGDHARFTIVLEESMPTYGILTIVKDTLTGVNYLIAAGDHGEGITPLLNRNGLPSVDR